MTHQSAGIDPFNAFIACHDCDLLQRIDHVSEGETASCLRCQAVLYCKRRNSIDRTLSFTLAGLVCLAIANVYPFMIFSLDGRAQQNTLLTGVVELYNDGMIVLALVVLFTSILAPALRLFCVLYVLLPLRFGRCARYAKGVMKWMSSLTPWAMLDVYMLGVLVAIVKLSALATIVPGPALYAFVALMFLFTLSTASFDSRLVWRELEACVQRSQQ